jgi:hypothetical protein
MADEPRDKAELLARIESSRRALLARLGAETEVALVVAGPDGGWSVKDHIAHIAAWERYLAALLTGADRWTEMGLTAAPSPPDETAINEAIYERNKDLSLRQVYAGWDAAHQMVLRAVEAMSEEDLMQPFSHFVPGATGEGVADPIVGWINGNTWGHTRNTLPGLKMTWPGGGGMTGRAADRRRGHRGQPGRARRAAGVDRRAGRRCALCVARARRVGDQGPPHPPGGVGARRGGHVGEARPLERDGAD